MSTYRRRAKHAGSWYDSNPERLNKTLDTFLSDGRSGSEGSSHPKKGRPQAIVAPHAGYSYSGATAGYAYATLVEAMPMTQVIVVLHPSHKVYLDGCAISGAETLETPLGDIPVDGALRERLLKTGHFSVMSQSDDENEHSGEMQYPFLRRLLNDFPPSSSSAPHHHVTVLPIMVGSIHAKREEHFGRLLAPILARPEVFTVVSSDFCHWGSRFQYRPVDTDGKREIFRHIEWLDRTGMEHICTQDPKAFTKYLKQTCNTICGRHAIGVWLNAVKVNAEQNIRTLDIEFVRYAQSSHVRNRNESSVSYASGVGRICEDL